MSRLVIRLACWLAPMFLAWFLLIRGADLVVGLLASCAIEALSALKASYDASSALLFTVSIRGMTLEVSVDSRLYTWGVPLAIALLLATRATPSRWHLALFASVALFTAVWGVAFDFLSQLLRDAPFALDPVTTLRANGIALGYQLGSLIFPGVIPLVVAVAISWNEIEQASFKTNQSG